MGLQSRRGVWRGGRVLVAVAAAALGGCALLGGGEPKVTPEQIAERAVRDTAIVREVQARLAAEPSIGSGSIRPVVVRDEVHLHGTVRGFGALQCAKANAELVPGVMLVVDFLVLQPGPSRVTCNAPRVFAGSQSGRSS